MQKYVVKDKGKSKEEIVCFFKEKDEAEKFVKKYKKNYRKLVVEMSDAFKKSLGLDKGCYRFESETFEEWDIVASNLTEAIKKAERLWDKENRGKSGGVKFLGEVINE